MNRKQRPNWKLNLLMPWSGIYWPTKFSDTNFCYLEMTQLMEYCGSSPTWIGRMPALYYKELRAWLTAIHWGFYDDFSPAWQSRSLALKASLAEFFMSMLIENSHKLLLTWHPMNSIFLFHTFLHFPFKLALVLGCLLANRTLTNRTKWKLDKDLYSGGHGDLEHLLIITKS